MDEHPAFLHHIDRCGVYSSPSETIQADPNEQNTSASLFWFQHEPNEDVLAERLTTSQRQKLNGVYLRLEGLVAIGRREFIVLFDEPSKQRQVLVLLEKYKKIVSGLHQSIYLQKDDNEIVLTKWALRQCAERLDLEIAACLSDSERLRLINILRDTSDLDATIHAGGSAEKFRAMPMDKP